jgi:hypothetical protein
MLVFLCWLIGLPFAPVVHSAGLSPGCESEIAHLLAYIEKSGCQFYRNGTWYKDTRAAREHIEMKYAYFLQKGRIASAEDFIAWAATKSEISGKPYMVKRGDNAPQPLAQWLITELDRYRKSRQAISSG